MGLFSKKSCDVCGEKIGLLGNRKLEDGNLCKECAKKLSPWFSDRRRSTVAEIKEQLAYREANQEKVAQFHTTRSLGERTKVLLDEDAGKFLVTSARDWKEASPDVLDFADVTGCRLDIDEKRDELTYEDADGKNVRYDPPRYEYSYDFYIDISVNNPYFNQIRFRLNDHNITVNTQTNPSLTIAGISLGGGSSLNLDNDPEYRTCKQMGEEIRAALTQVRQTVRDNIKAANAPKQAMTCPYCGATTTPDANGCCEYCGGAVKG